MGQGPNMDRQLRRAFALGSWGPAEGFHGVVWGWRGSVPTRVVSPTFPVAGS